VAYVAATTEGREVVKLMEEAFARKKLMQLQSTTDNNDDDDEYCVVPVVELKTEHTEGNGYPDVFYLKRVHDQLTLINRD